MMLYWRKQDACNLVDICYKLIVSVTNTPLIYPNGHIKIDLKNDHAIMRSNRNHLVTI